jgi:hypothetical protein
MHRTSPRPAGFVLTATGIFVIGLLSALVDGTLGWEYLAQEFLLRLPH